MDSYCKKIKELREILGYSQADFAKKIGVIQQAVAYQETRAKKPHRDYLARIMQAFNFKVDAMILAKNAGEIIDGAQKEKNIEDATFTEVKKYDEKDLEIAALKGRLEATEKMYVEMSREIRASLQECAELKRRDKPVRVPSRH